MKNSIGFAFFFAVTASCCVTFAWDLCESFWIIKTNFVWGFSYHVSKLLFYISSSDILRNHFKCAATKIEKSQIEWKFQKRLNLIIVRNQFLHLIVLIMQRFSILAFFCTFYLISYANEWYRFETRLSMQMRFSFQKKNDSENIRVKIT